MNTIFKKIFKMFEMNLTEFRFEVVENHEKIMLWKRIVTVYFNNFSYNNRFEGAISSGKLLLREYGKSRIWSIEINEFEPTGEIYRPLIISKICCKVSFHQFDDEILNLLSKHHTESEK